MTEKREVSHSEPSVWSVSRLLIEREKAKIFEIKAEGIKKDRRVDSWWKNLDENLSMLFPKHAPVVGEMIRSGLDRERGNGWLKSLQHAVGYPSGINYEELAIKQGLAVAHFDRTRTKEEIYIARTAVMEHIEELNVIGKKGRDTFNGYREHILANLTERMQGENSTLDDLTDYQLLKNDPRHQPGQEHDDPFYGLFASLGKGHLPCQIDDISLSSRDKYPIAKHDKATRKSVCIELSNNITAMKDYELAKGVTEGFSYVLGEDNGIAELVEEWSKGKGERNKNTTNKQITQ